MWAAENETSGARLGDRIRLARSFFARRFGLLFRHRLEEGEGLWIEPCRSIHTFGMRYAIDAIFLDREGRVVAVVEELRPWRATRVYFDARAVLELPAGTARRSGTRAGDRIRLHRISGNATSHTSRPDTRAPGSTTASGPTSAFASTRAPGPIQAGACKRAPSSTTASGATYTPSIASKPGSR